MNLYLIDYAILGVYVLFVVGIGFALKRSMKTSSDFFSSGRAIPAWITGLAFMSANLGALELVGMAASGAKYGIATCHFYWVGAIPAMIFLGVFMMPFYYGSKARSVPEYLKLRFDERVRCLNSMTFAVMTVFASGISMDALARLLNEVLGWRYELSLTISSAVVVLYVFKGGLTSAIYTEVLQFFMIVLGFAPVVYLGMRDLGGWDNLKAALHTVAAKPTALDLASAPLKTGYPPNAWTSAWSPLLAGPAHNPMGVDVYAMFFGLGFVLSFGYWCTDFLVIQRAMAARNMTAARRTPLIAAVPKMLLPILVILPGMIAVGLAATESANYRLPKEHIDETKATSTCDLAKSLSGRANADDIKAIEKVADHKFYKDQLTAILNDPSLPKLGNDEIIGRLNKAVSDNDYGRVIVSLTQRYCPPGLLGLALTALLSSFMSGMAGNITAVNTVWTYDLYQAYIAPNKSDAHYMWMGRMATIVGILLSAAAAFLASKYSNAMDIIQLVFGFVNAPLFATFLLGMFYKRTTATGAFYGLLGGTGISAMFHALTLATENEPGVKGGYLYVVQKFPSDMARNFWLAIFAFAGCFLLTLGISLLTRRDKTDEELKGLVYSLTPHTVDEHQPWYLGTGFLGLLLLLACVFLNYLFW